MLPRIFSLVSFFVVPLPCFAQSSSPEPRATPESQSASQSPSHEAQPAKKDSKQAKRVWTNEDLANLKPGGISVVGEARPQKPAGPGARPEQKPADSVERLATLYRQQLARLRADLEQVDKKLGELRSFNASNASAAGGLSMSIYAYRATSVSDQIAQLEGQRKQIEARMEALEDDARHKGIPPGDLR